MTEQTLFPLASFSLAFFLYLPLSKRIKSKLSQNAIPAGCVGWPIFLIICLILRFLPDHSHYAELYDAYVGIKILELFLSFSLGFFFWMGAGLSRQAIWESIHE